MKLAHRIAVVVAALLVHGESDCAPSVKIELPQKMIRAERFIPAENCVANLFV